MTKNRKQKQAVRAVQGAQDGTPYMEARRVESEDIYRHKAVWYRDDIEFIGATGVNSVREFAELISKDAEICRWVFEDGETTAKSIIEVLETGGVEAMSVPIQLLDAERWDNGWESNSIHKVDIAAIVKKPHAKVLGFSI